MRRCIFCGQEADVASWVFQGVSGLPLSACRSCAQERGLTAAEATPSQADDPPGHLNCRCCGRPLPGADGWPLIVWVQDRSGLMAVCNACRVDYALEPVFTSVRRARRDGAPGPPSHDEAGAPPSD